jgi:hypothetical protein
MHSKCPDSCPEAESDRQDDESWVAAKERGFGWNGWRGGISPWDILASKRNAPYQK